MRGTMEVLMVLNVGGLQEHGQIFKDLNECRYVKLLLGLGRISGVAGYPAIFNIRPDTGY